MIFDKVIFKEIFDTLSRNKSRSILTGFGIFWGVFMLLFMAGGGSGLIDMLKKNFSGFATNTTLIYSSITTKPWCGLQEGRYWHLNESDLNTLKSMVPELDRITPMNVAWRQNANHGTNTIECNLKGIYNEYANVEEPKLRYGRFINESDCWQKRKVCVIGKKIYYSLFPNRDNPCGTFIKVGPTYFQIVGVDFSAGNISINGNASQSVIIPFTSFNLIFNRGDDIDMIALTGKTRVIMSSLEPRIRQIIARKHSFDPTDKQALEILNTEQLFQVMDSFFKGLYFFIWLVGIGTILSGAIGVSNIMMVTVKERTAEIGIRRALGATPKQVLSQILCESIVLTLSAGAFGVIFSVISLAALGNAVSPMSNVVPDAFQISFSLAVSAIVLLMILGILAGLMPAIQTMRIKPVDAMRVE